ncbi:MAG: hypothetical protein Terrestrivirus4_202 [Terrestrivirus sp.]|uniref:Uncharacterized protein n=1 Tax=Terrestrivirus sp. TaxID=2487775 RepID=A0A3G4ZP32_9VIRU|nr:MAG: hypothetical protein Terrestrivirus4_202 [Terrestrivirus sp.]
MGDNDLKTFFSKKEMCYYVMIDKYFKKCSEDMITKMINIINGEDNISLRILDWFVTRYAKKGIDFTSKNGDLFDVHINYKAQLKSYKKKYFDPFRRKYKFNYQFTIDGEKKTLLTTIGQLNFFGWAISNNIINFVDQYLQQITKAMNLSNKEDKKKKAEKNKSKNTSDDSDEVSNDDDDNDNDDNDYDDDDNIDYDNDDDNYDHVNNDNNDNNYDEVDPDNLDNSTNSNDGNGCTHINKMNNDISNLDKNTSQKIQKQINKQKQLIHIEEKSEKSEKSEKIEKSKKIEKLEKQKIQSNGDEQLTKKSPKKSSKVVVRGKKKSDININASKRIEVDEVELTLSFD